MQADSQGVTCQVPHCTHEGYAWFETVTEDVYLCQTHSKWATIPAQRRSEDAESVAVQG